MFGSDTQLQTACYWRRENAPSGVPDRSVPAERKPMKVFVIGLMGTADTDSSAKCPHPFGIDRAEIFYSIPFTIKRCYKTGDSTSRWIWEWTLECNVSVSRLPKII